MTSGSMTSLSRKYSKSLPKAADVRRTWEEQERQRMSEAHPACVRVSEFIRRNLKAEIAAGRCVVTNKRTLGFKETVVTIVDVQPNYGNNFTAVTADGSSFICGDWYGRFDVKWKVEHTWCPVVPLHSLAAEFGAPIEPVFTWQRHSAAVCYKPE